MMQDLITTIAALEIMHLDNANNPFPLSMESQYELVVHVVKVNAAKVGVWPASESGSQGIAVLQSE